MINRGTITALVVKLDAPETVGRLILGNSGGDLTNGYTIKQAVAQKLLA